MLLIELRLFLNKTVGYVVRILSKLIFTNLIVIFIPRSHFKQIVLRFSKTMPNPNSKRDAEYRRLDCEPMLQHGGHVYSPSFEKASS